MREQARRLGTEAVLKHGNLVFQLRGYLVRIGYGRDEPSQQALNGVEAVDDLVHARSFHAGA